MPASPSERNADPRPSGDRAPEQWRDPDAGPAMRTAPREEPEGVRTDETPEEPGYGHGV